MDSNVERDLLAYIDAGPSPFHVVAETAARLERAGFRRLAEADAWQLAPGDKVYLVRDGATLAALRLGKRAPEETGLRLIGAHTDSPCLRLKPQPELAREGYRQLGVEVYGGALYSTWLDRDLTLAGRVLLARDGAPHSELVRFADACLRVPNLAIHLNRGVNDSLVLNAQQHLVPVYGLGDRAGFSLKEELATMLGPNGTLKADDVLGFDLALAAVEPARFGGASGEFVFAPRLDNLAGCHGALSALLRSADNAEATVGVVLFDHEEVGSESARGAGSTLLKSLIVRVLEAYAPVTETRVARALARSLFVSSDMAHGVHPNYADRHEPSHRPLLGQGPVLKSNVNARYATDGETWALFELLARKVGTPLQKFVVRTDLGCGSTIGPVTAASLGMRTVDIGNPMLSMHSCREMAATADIAPMIRLLAAFLES